MLINAWRHLGRASVLWRTQSRCIRRRQPTSVQCISGDVPKLAYPDVTVWL